VTSPAPSGSTSRRRIAGLALVGIGVIAAIIGLGTLTLGGGGDGGGTAAPLTESAAPTAGAEPGAGSLTPAPPTASGPITVPTFPTTTANVAAPPATEPPADAGGADQGGGADAGTGAPKGPIRVYNNSTITGLASNAATDFKSAGWEVGDVANYPFGIISTTTVYYRPGTEEQGIAEELGREFGLRVNPRFEGLKDATPGVIVIVTNDFPSKSK
jgi:LytR cell envelope-related transcriptional attenuator